MVRLLKFVAIGGAATLFQFILLAVMVESQWLDATPASAVSYALSAIFNYLANYYFTFASTQKHSTTLPKFILTATLGVAINTVVFKISLVTLQDLFMNNPQLDHYMQLLAEWVSSSALTIMSLVAQLFATIVTLIVNFLLHKFWIYRR